MILLDTHALVWLDEGNHKLGNKSLSLIDEALKTDELYVSTISFWETEMLVDTRSTGNAHRNRFMAAKLTTEWSTGNSSNG